MKSTKDVFTGCATALVTPFTDKGIDYESYGKLIDWQIEKGADALVVLGTTGESATIDEFERVILSRASSVIFLTVCFTLNSQNSKYPHSRINIP